MNNVVKENGNMPITQRRVAQMEATKRQLGNASSVLKDLVTDKVQVGFESATNEFSFTQQEMMRHPMGNRETIHEPSLSTLIPVAAADSNGSNEDECE